MAIRSAARGLILKEGQALLERLADGEGGVMDTLPGGGQNQYEPLTETAVREVREESGYEVSVGRLVAVCEEIVGDPALREQSPDYTHRVHHIFLCAVKDMPCGAATEPDLDQMDCVWMPLAEADALESLHPKAIREKLAALAKAESCEFLGCEFISD